MTFYNPRGTHEHYTRIDCHFCPKSAKYAGADSLLTAQRRGWRLVGLAYRQDIMLRGGRHTTIYHFELSKNSETLIMPIVSNPFIVRMLHRRRISVLSLRQMPESTVDSLVSELA